MEGVFSLPYSEYQVINHLQKKLKKSDGYSIFIPVSRQQKGIDFIIQNLATKKTLRFQVKSSRAYIHEPKEMKNGKIKYNYYLWLNNFIDRYEKDNADYYILYGLYPTYNSKKSVKSKNWNSIILCYSENEMIELLNRVKTKKEKKKDQFFGFGFNTPKQIFATRGLEEHEDSTCFLIENKIQQLKSDLS